MKEGGEQMMAVALMIRSFWWDEGVLGSDFRCKQPTRFRWISRASKGFSYLKLVRSFKASKACLTAFIELEVLVSKGSCGN
jgi:hypothetical protein